MVDQNVQDQELKQVDESSEQEELDDSKVDETTKNDDEQDEEAEKPVERPVYQMPVKKHQAEKEKWRAKESEYKQKLADMEAKLKSGVIDDEVKKFADEQELRPEAVAGLVGLAEKKLSSKLAPNERIEKLLQKQEVAEAKNQVSSEFDDRVAQQIRKDYPSVTQEHLNKIKKEITDLAFTNKYNRYDLVDIYLANKSKFEFKDTHTAESSSGRTGDYVNYNTVNDKDIAKMSPQEYKKYSDFMAKKQGRWN